MTRMRVAGIRWMQVHCCWRRRRQRVLFDGVYKMQEALMVRLEPE